MQPILDCATAITMTLQRLARHVVTEVRAVAELDLLMTLGWQLEALIVRPLDIDAERTWVLVPPARLHQTAWGHEPDAAEHGVHRRPIGDGVDAGRSAPERKARLGELLVAGRRDSRTGMTR